MSDHKDKWIMRLNDKVKQFLVDEKLATPAEAYEAVWGMEPIFLDAYDAAKGEVNESS